MWYYNNKPFDPEGINKKELYGFVYVIRNIKTNKKYIGKKFFWARKNKKLVESNWRDYWGSSTKLQEDVDLLGKEMYTRTIIHLCKTKAECGYMEAYEQFQHNALLSDEYYNDWISVRVTARHIEKIKQNIMEKTRDYYDFS